MYLLNCRARFLLGGRHGDFKFLPPPGYAPCYEALLPKERMRIEPIKEYKHDFDGVRNLLGPTQSLSHTSFTPCPVDTAQVGLLYTVISGDLTMSAVTRLCLFPCEIKMQNRQTNNKKMLRTAAFKRRYYHVIIATVG